MIIVLNVFIFYNGEIRKNVFNADLKKTFFTFRTTKVIWLVAEIPMPCVSLAHFAFFGDITETLITPTLVPTA